MSSVSYIANGFSKEPTESDPLRGFSEIRVWNHMPYETKVGMRVYFSDKPPANIPEFSMGAGSDPLLMFHKGPFAEHYPKFFKDCGPWGMRIVSDTALIIDHIMSAGRQGPPDNVKFRGGCNDSLAKTRLSRLWYFGDGQLLLWDPDHAPWPFNEFEWYHILNPNRQEAHVVMEVHRGGGVAETHSYAVGAERVLLIDNYEMFKRSGKGAFSFSLKFISDQPIVVESERFICGHHSLEEWGAHIHCARPGVPAPLEWNEEDVADLKERE